MILGPAGFGDPEPDPVLVRGTGTEAGTGTGGDEDFDSKKSMEAETDEERGMAGGLGGVTIGPEPCSEGRLMLVSPILPC